MTTKGNPAIVITGTQSGSGKTTITLGLLAALQKMGYAVQPFKCGPDFIDPTLHRLVTGRISYNLDPWMCGAAFVRNTFDRHGRQADISIIEGVMGMFDGGESSSASLARVLGAPVVLVLDVRSAAESVAAVLKGFELLDPDTVPKAVILNKVASDRHFDLVATAIKEHCQAEILGYLPRDPDLTIPSRHLGLQMGQELPLGKKELNILAGKVASHVNLERLLEIAEECRMPELLSSRSIKDSRVRIGVARDPAFCFYYEDNLDLLRQAGAKLVFFSPLEDVSLPEEIDGLYFGGGYPEMHAKKLAANTAMLDSVRRQAENGLPVYAECGGFMYLTEGIYDEDGQLLQMAGIFPVTARMRTKRASLGYREVCLRENFLFGPAGTTLRGHEFHYSVIDEMPGNIERLYLVDNKIHEGYRYKNVLGSYMHLHFGSNPEAAPAFISTCQG